LGYIIFTRVNDPDQERAHTTEQIKVHQGRRDNSATIRDGDIYIYLDRVSASKESQRRDILIGDRRFIQTR
jgi:hypothetical protein